MINMMAQLLLMAAPAPKKRKDHTYEIVFYTPYGYTIMTLYQIGTNCMQL